MERSLCKYRPMSIVFFVLLLIHNRSLFLYLRVDITIFFLVVLLDSSTPSSPGDYRLQLWALTNSTIGTYPELLRRSFGGSSDSGDSSTEASYDAYNLRTNSTLLNCGSITTGSASRIRSEIVSGNSTSGLLPLLDLGLMESVIDLPLHVQYTINVGISLFQVKRRNSNDVINPGVPVHLHLLEGMFFCF
jgi:hypothetical protein